MEQKTDAQKTILTVEDEKNLVDTLRFNLQREGYQTCEAYDGADGLEKARKENPDLILLDVMLPKMIGFDVCRTLREEGNNVPVIILTAREEEADKVSGLEIGADDYITKPFLTEELIARIRAVMRRAHTSEEHNAQREYRNGPMRLSESSRSLWINDREVKLADSEYHLMLALMKHPGSVISHEHLLQRVWGGHSIGDVQNLRVAFSRIRRKLEENGLQGGVISAYSGVGYLLRDLVRDPLL